MADAKSEQDDLKKDVQVIQNMIDISAQRLEGLRTQCQTSAELTKQEIRTLEGKLLKLFSDLIVKKSKLNSNTVEHAPSLKLWLKVVGLGQQSIDGICNKISSIEELQEKSEHDLRVILNEHHAATEEFNRLCRALHNLKRYIDVLRKGGNETPDMNLFWDSYDRNHQLKSGLSPRTGRSRAARASVPSEEGFFNNNNNHRGGSVIPPSASVSSINSLNAQCAVLGPPPPPLTPPGHTKGKGMKFPTTPPAKRKLLTGISPNLHPEMYPLTKSKSQDSELTASKTENGDISTNGTGRRARLPTEPGPETNASCTSPLMTSPIKSPPFCNNVCTDSDDNSVKSISLPVPKSPRSTPCGPRVMTHHINHRFNKKFEVLKTCAYCQKPIYLKTSLKCKECKYTCHRHCEDLVPACCGLPPEYLLAFKETLAESGVLSPPTGRQPKPINRLRKPSHPQPGGNPAFQNPDSSSNTSSCNSSTPSSPAIPSINTPHSLHKQPTFHFPDVTETNDEINDSAVFTSVDLVLTQTTDTTRTASLSGGSTSTDSDRTPVRVDSQDSQVSDTDTITDDHQLARQHSLSMREWDIPFHEVVLGNEIGTGRFGTVYQGKWHGDVAVKILNVNYLKDEKTLEQFKMEVATFRKTRHENLILFMGACMKPPQLAIVTSLLSKGNTLYTHIHLRKDKFNMNRTTIVAQQISQGMGYLHAKGIIHKDLKSKNIFLENGKVVITDFGLFSITKLCFGNRRQDSLNIPPGWLCYLAPEIMRSLRAYQSHDEELPFTTASDVYAFGTVWYELLCGEWPFKGQPPEAVIWQVGKGIKQPLANLQASRDVKDILMACWMHDPNDRKDFVELQSILEKFPKKRLARSPSHPIHLSRSAESVF